MKEYKYVGRQDEANAYGLNCPVLGESYSEDTIIGYEDTVKYWAEESAFKSEWQLVEDKVLPCVGHEFQEEVKSLFHERLPVVMEEIKSMLLEKNAKYGDSAINPIRVFSNASNIEQIKVRLDDKLSRLKTQHIEEDEDVLNDLIGYLVLLKICIK